MRDGEECVKWESSPSWRLMTVSHEKVDPAAKHPTFVMF